MTDYDWGMYSNEGNIIVEAEMAELRRRVFAGEVRRFTLESDLTKVIARIGKSHGEVGDTEVRGMIYDEVDRWCVEQQWKKLYDFS